MDDGADGGQAEEALSFGAIAQQLRISLTLMSVAAAIVFAVALAILAVHYLTDINVLVLTVDPAAEVGLAPYVGVVSYVGILALWSGASVAIFSAVNAERRGRRTLLLTLGLIMGLLALDDLFLIHEEIGLRLATAAGNEHDRSLWEAPVFAIYGGIIVIWLWVFRRGILRTRWALLGAGFLALATSAAIDIGEYLLPNLAASTPWMATTISIAEDLIKLAGLILLLLYATVTGRTVLGRCPRHEEFARAD